MACALTSESRRLYSWWWDSHISPKNSKWLQENLTDMDTKVKSMIKLIEEDADSFARRAEMYYKKRPELMKLVEEFYRAYRALAERYDHATSELRHAQKTLQAAFPDQEPEDSSSSINPDAQKHESFGLQLFLQGNLQSTNEKDECEVERLKKVVADLIAEKDSLFVQRYQFGLGEFSNADGEINRGQESLWILEEKTNKAEKEVDMLKETKQIEHLETISDLVDQRAVDAETISVLEKKIVMIKEEAVKAEMEVEKLKTAVLELTEEKEALQVLYAKCLEKSYALELDLSSAQSDVQRLTAEILNSSRSLTGQLELTRLNPESFGSSVKYLQDENSRLHTDLQSSFESLHVEKSALVRQKAVLEDSLSAANIELGNLRERSKGLEQLCELLNNEKSNLSVESVQKRLDVLENRFMQFEKEKEAGNCRMLELVSSTVKKQEHESRNRMMMNQKRLDDLENKLKKEELQEELDKAVIAQFENFILHKFVKELEEENHCLSVDNAKHVEACKLADRLIFELENEILEQQVDVELLLVEVENLRLGMYQVFLSLGVGSKSSATKIATEEIIDNIKRLKHCLLKEEDDKQRVVIENTVISTVLMNKYETMKDNFFKFKKQNLDLIEVLNAEAAKFIFDLQISNTRDIVFESKVHELAEVCESLEGESTSKDLEIEELKRKASVMESEIEGLKAQLLAYTPVIGSLKENISTLEHNVFTVANLVASNNRKTEDVEVKVHLHHNQRDRESSCSPKSQEPNGISDLIEFQTRIAALEKVIVEVINPVARRKTSTTNIKPKPAKPETEESKSNDYQRRNKEEKLRGRRYLTLDHINIPKTKPEFSEMRDIQLDQASDGSSSARSRSRSRRGYLRSDDRLIERLQIAHRIYETENKSSKLPYEPQIEDLGVYKLQVSNQESKKGKLLQRLANDAQKLGNLETTVKDLTKRLEAGKKCTKPNGVDFKIVKEQLEQAEETILHLSNVNVESTANAEKNLSLAAWLEQDDVWKRSERIKTVQLDVENIQSVLLKLDDEKKNKGKSRFSMSKSRTSVVLRDFIHRGGRTRRRRLCGCFTSSMTKGDRVKS